MDKNKTQDLSFMDGISKPLFIVFAEFLGYVSPLVEWAENYCKGKSIENFKMKVLLIEADAVLNKMLEEYDAEKIKEWWDRYYPYLEEYDEIITKAEKSDLPF